MARQASEKLGLLLPDHHQKIGCWARKCFNSELVPGTFSALTNLLLSPQASAQSQKMFRILFSCLNLNTLRGLSHTINPHHLHPALHCTRRCCGAAGGTVSLAGNASPVTIA